VSESSRGAADAVLEGLSRGRPPRADAARALFTLLGTSVGREGLSRFFQPGFPGLRTFVVDARADPDQSVELTIVGVARDGAPVWIARRVLLRGRDGSLEIHHLSDHVAPEHRSRNVLVDSVRRELALLEAVRQRGPSARITLEASGVARYLAALHGCLFADATDLGPSLRSGRPRDPSSDRAALVDAAYALLRRLSQRHAVPAVAALATSHAIDRAEHPWHFARLDLEGVPWPTRAGDEAKGTDDVHAGGFGRALLLADETPSWRAALPLDPPVAEARQVGDAFRARQASRAEARHAREIGEARDALASGNRATKLRALDVLAAIGPAWITPEVRALTESSDRRVATAARHALAAMSGTDLAEHLLRFADDAAHDAERRGLAYRVLAEHFPQALAPRVSMLRVHPDARLQRAIIPILADEPSEAGPDMASLLAANPWDESLAWGPDTPRRPGLLELRVELVERLALRPDPREMTALTRALVAYADPRARTALSQIAHRLDRPQVP
jgi:hypothetical protein